MQICGDVLQEDFFLIVILDIGQDILDLSHLFRRSLPGTFGFRDKEIFSVHCHKGGQQGELGFKLITGITVLIGCQNIPEHLEESGEFSPRFFQLFGEAQPAGKQRREIMALYIVVHLEGQERGIEYNGVVDGVFSLPGVHGMEKAGVDEKKISCFSRVFTVFYGDGKFPSFNQQDLKFRMPVVGYADLRFVLVFQIEMEPVGFQRVQISAPFCLFFILCSGALHIISFKKWKFYNK